MLKEKGHDGKSDALPGMLFLCWLMPVLDLHPAL
jgi:hypothetical protein